MASDLDEHDDTRETCRLVEVPMEPPGQLCEFAPDSVMLARSEARYVSGATIAVTGGKPIV